MGFWAGARGRARGPEPELEVRVHVCELHGGAQTQADTLLGDLVAAL